MMTITITVFLIEFYEETLMSKPIIDIFCEDTGHELTIRSVLSIIMRDFGLDAIVRPLNVAGGHGAVLKELVQYYQDIAKGRTHRPDMVVAARDANCNGYLETTKLMQKAKPPELESLPTVYAVPDPHIERWLLSDQTAFKSVFGIGCSRPASKCERGYYKKALKDSILSAGINPRLGGVEFAPALIEQMNFDRFSFDDDSFKRFISDLRPAIRLLLK